MTTLPPRRPVDSRSVLADVPVHNISGDGYSPLQSTVGGPRILADWGNYNPSATVNGGWLLSGLGGPLLASWASLDIPATFPPVVGFTREYATYGQAFVQLGFSAATVQMDGFVNRFVTFLATAPLDVVYTSPGFAADAALDIFVGALFLTNTVLSPGTEWAFRRFTLWGRYA